MSLYRGLQSGVGQYVAAERHVAGLGGPRKDATKRGYIVHYGAGSDATVVIGDLNSAMANPSSPRSISQQLNDLRVPVGSADFAGGATFGNDTGQARVGSLWTYLKNNYGAKTDKVLLAGVSGGATVALNWALNNLASVAAIALAIPAIDLVDIHTNNRSIGGTTSVSVGTTNGSTTVSVPGGQATSSWVNATIAGAGIPTNAGVVSVQSATSITISAAATATATVTAAVGGLAYWVAAAYGGEAGFSAAMPAHNPASNASTFNGAVPIKIWYSGNDPACTPASVTAFGSASGATLVNTGNNGHATDGSQATTDAFAAFLAQYA